MQVLRTAAVSALAKRRPHEAARYWHGHPAVEMSLAMNEIAGAAVRGGTVPTSVFALLSDVSAKEPLAAEPFVIGGFQSQRSGDEVTAQRLFKAARWRDPRSLSAGLVIYPYVHDREVQHGLDHIGTVARPNPQARNASYRTHKVWPDG